MGQAEQRARPSGGSRNQLLGPAAARRHAAAPPRRHDAVPDLAKPRCLPLPAGPARQQAALRRRLYTTARNLTAVSKSGRAINLKTKTGK